jgi:hypothetical protein
VASQQNVDAWWNWATGVLHGIGAPTSPENYKTLWNWSIKESGQDPINNGSIHNNPLNTTQRVPGSTSQNSVGVQSFPDVTSGISATIQTLTNGRYPQIVSDLKGGVPGGLWTNPKYTGLNPNTTAAELKTWGSGTNWLGWSNTPPAPSAMFQQATGVGGSNSGPFGTITPLDSSGSNPVGDAINSALGNALGPIGTAITGAETNFVQTATNYFLMGVGVLFMLGGLALIAVMTLKVPAPVREVAGVAANVTPAGRAASVAKAASPAPKPLSPGAQSAVAAAKAGRGSKLSPDVKEELQGRAA